VASPSTGDAPAPAEALLTATTVAPPSTGDAPAPTEAVGSTPAPARPSVGPRHRRRLSRRRRRVEQWVIALIFVAALGVTVLLLASQWLLNSSVTGAIG
ncbi:MAG: hypothetical protein J2O47_10555, partial [Acidimicrobiaceae bacterium]|nr:hypothetical protein [Acidimicrobiaceae bacterium]